MEDRNSYSRQHAPAGTTILVKENASGPGDQALSAEEYEFCGKHLIASYMNCDQERLRDIAGVGDAMRRAIESSGATILSFNSHVFPGDGLTSVYLLSESHASIHTYPEHDSCFVDIFTCGFTCEPERFHSVLLEYFRPGRVSKQLMIRGEENLVPDSDELADSVGSVSERRSG